MLLGTPSVFDVHAGVIYLTWMIHRHLTHRNYTMAAIDDVIQRGTMSDWVDLREAIRAEPVLLDKVERICLAYIANEYAQRHWFWWNYSQAARGAKNAKTAA